ncbi:MAG: hypothetical protein JRM87_02155 [Nitrososphaerota archaeon]|nr:hypothetical protein [Nitrososphaerota archaeon]
MTRPRGPPVLDLRPLKSWARTLPAELLLRQSIEAEEDEMGAGEFVRKVDLWLRLASDNH